MPKLADEYVPSAGINVSGPRKILTMLTLMEMGQGFVACNVFVLLMAIKYINTLIWDIRSIFSEI
jgi:hypothetical protein